MQFSFKLESGVEFTATDLKQDLQHRSRRFEKVKVML